MTKKALFESLFSYYLHLAGLFSTFSCSGKRVDTFNMSNFLLKCSQLINVKGVFYAS